MAPRISVDTERRLYVIRDGSGHTCLGFDVAERHIRQIAAWVNMPLFDQPLGTFEHYATYRRALDWGAKHAAKTRTRCEADLTPQLVGLEGKHVEVRDESDAKPRRFRVGKSTGWYPIHLELAWINSRGGGGAMRTYHSVRVVSPA